MNELTALQAHALRNIDHTQREAVDAYIDADSADPVELDRAIDRLVELVPDQAIRADAVSAVRVLRKLRSDDEQVHAEAERLLERSVVPAVERVWGHRALAALGPDLRRALIKAEALDVLTEEAEDVKLVTALHAVITEKF